MRLSVHQTREVNFSSSRTQVLDVIMELLPPSVFTSHCQQPFHLSPSFILPTLHD